MDLEQAIQVHSEWKVKLRGAIVGKASLDAAAIFTDHQCVLGRWLHGEGKAKYGRLTAYAKCVHAHAAFHKAAGQVAQTINDKKFAAADKMLEVGTEFAKTSSAVGVAILGLKRESAS